MNRDSDICARKARFFFVRRCFARISRCVERTPFGGAAGQSQNLPAFA